MIRLAIVEDNGNYLNALKLYIAKVQDIQLVHIAYDLQSLSLLIAAKPDVVIMDIDLGADSGIQGIQQIKEALPHTGIFMLTVFDDEEKIVQSLRAGASGYLLKKDSPKKIVEAIYDVYKGEGVIGGQVVKTLIKHLAKPLQNTSPNFSGYNLTTREMEIAGLLMKGFSYKEIAARSFISMATLNTHIRNLYDKLEVHSRSEMAAKFLN